MRDNLKKAFPAERWAYGEHTGAPRQPVRLRPRRGEETITEGRGQAGSAGPCRLLEAFCFLS